MELHWLRLVGPCTLELPNLKDYAGLPLLFKRPGLTRRLVSAETLKHALVQRYLTLNILVEEQKMVENATPPAAPTPSIELTSVIESTPEVPEAPESSPVPEPPVESDNTSVSPEPISEVTEDDTAEDPDQEIVQDFSDGDSNRSSRRRRRGNR